MCHGCAEKGHIKPKCRNKDKWASYAEKKSKVDANLASTELTPASYTESFIFSIIKQDTLMTVNLAAEKQPADYWILDTGATNDFTGNHHLYQVLSSHGIKRSSGQDCKQ